MKIKSLWLQLSFESAQYFVVVFSFFFLKCLYISISLFHDPTGGGVWHHWWECDVWSHPCVTTVSSHHWCLLMLEEDGAAHLRWWVFCFEPCFPLACKLCLKLYCDTVWKLKWLLVCFRSPQGDLITLAVGWQSWVVLAVRGLERSSIWFGGSPPFLTWFRVC